MQMTEEGEKPFLLILHRIKVSPKIHFQSRVHRNHIQSPTFSRVKGRWHMKYGREEISITALESDYKNKLTVGKQIPNHQH